MGKLVLIEIPKTGTTSLNARLKTVYKNSFWKDRWEQGFHKEIFWGLRESFPKSRYRGFGKELGKSYFERFDCIVGSFPLSKFYYLKEKGWTIATWMRDPLKRRISWYNRNWNNPNHRKYWDYPNEPTDIVSFVKKAKNVYGAYYDLGTDLLDFVGFTETFDESFSQLCGLLGIEKEPPRAKRNISSPKMKTNVTDEQIEILTEWLDEEYEIYNKMREKFSP